MLRLEEDYAPSPSHHVVPVVILVLEPTHSRVRV